MLKRTLSTLAIAVVCLVTTASTALADYPPEATVKGKTVHTVAPDTTLAFTGSDTVLWIVVAVVLLTAGAALLAWASRRSTETT